MSQQLAIFGDLFSSLPDGDGCRYYQTDAISAIRSAWHAGNRSVLLVMATGTGKTKVFCRVAAEQDGKVLVIAHRDELIQQAQAALEAETGEFVDLEQAGFHASSRARIVMASVQTLSQKKRLGQFSPEHFQLVICDEAHRSVAPTYRRIFDHFSGARILGVTATPDRADETALGLVYESVPLVFDIEDGVTAGYLVPVRGRQVILDEVELDNVGTQGGDLNLGQLDEEMLKAVEGIVRKTLELEPERQGVVFLPGIRSAEYCAERFNQLSPGCACFVSGETDPDERRTVTRDFKRGVYKYFVNCQIATEGWDCPTASLIVQGRPTKSRALYAQMIGRGTRVLPGVVDHLDGPKLARARREAIAKSTKPDMMILDMVGNSTRHALVTALDALAGNYEEDEVQLAKEKSKDSPGADQRALLEAARSELRALAARARARSLRATVRDFNPFAILHLDSDTGIAGKRFGGTPISEKQLEHLKKKGMKPDELKDLSKAQASKLIDNLIRRHDQGLATFAQLQQLRKFGIDKPDLTFERAGDAMTYVATTVWQKQGQFDPAELNRIVFAQRQPGED